MKISNLWNQLIHTITEVAAGMRCDGLFSCPTLHKGEKTFGYQNLQAHSKMVDFDAQRVTFTDAFSKMESGIDS